MTGIGLLLLVAAAPSAPAAPHDLMPAPAALTWQPGALAVDSGFGLAASGACDERIEAGLRRLGQALERELGQRLKQPRREEKAAAFVVRCAAAGRAVQAVGEDESYTLSVAPRGARLEAPTTLGALRGLETFLQMLRREAGRLSVPAVRIEDRPRFAWRGLLVDVCRHFQPMEVMKRTLDGMAAVKLNVLHWHLTEDQGFRVESRRFPRLYQMGSDGLFYTQDQVREVIAHARDRGIRVVPEFDLPGHTTAWFVGHPELASAPGPYAIERRWGVFDPSMDPSREEVYGFLDAFLGEMAALFPDEYVHVGGDEVTGRQWNQSPKIQEFLYERGLRDNEALQAFFNTRLSAILEKHGKRMVGWDEVLHEGLPRTSVVQSWRGAEGLAEAVRGGHDAILSHGYYLDHMQPASAHYAVDPLPASSPLSDAERARVLGAEACMWGEFVTPETIDSRIWPRAAAIAERLWSPAEARDPDDMYRRLARQSERLTALGLAHQSGYEPMLRRIAGGKPVEPLRVLADVVEPVRLYGRGRHRAYTQRTPLDRLVDAARPESDAARVFRREVDRFLRAAPELGEPAGLRASLERWARNHASLDPVLAASPYGAELRSLSRNLSSLGAAGLEALDTLVARRQANEEWQLAAGRTVQLAEAPRAELELAPLPAVKKLILAASRFDQLRRQGAAEWNAALDAALAPRRRPE